jgi:hypothetical protein
MKFLTVILFSLLALNVYSAEEGEDQSSICPYASQTNKREAKVVAPVETDIKKEEESKNTSK